METSKNRKVQYPDRQVWTDMDISQAVGLVMFIVMVALYAWS